MTVLAICADLRGPLSDKDRMPLYLFPHFPHIFLNQHFQSFPLNDLARFKLGIRGASYWGQNMWVKVWRVMGDNPALFIRIMMWHQMALDIFGQCNLMLSTRFVCRQMTVSVGNIPYFHHKWINRGGHIFRKPSTDMAGRKNIIPPSRLYYWFIKFAIRNTTIPYIKDYSLYTILETSHDQNAYNWSTKWWLPRIISRCKIFHKNQDLLKYFSFFGKSIH